MAVRHAGMDGNKLWDKSVGMEGKEESGEIFAGEIFEVDVRSGG